MQEAPEKPPERDSAAATRQSWRRAVDLSAVGIAFPIALIMGFVLGREVGDWLGYPVAGRVIGGFVGAAAGFRNLLTMAKSARPPMRAPARGRVLAILGGAVAIWAAALGWLWLQGASAEGRIALTAASALGIFAFGSFLPLVERVYSLESQRLHPLSSWLLTAHTLIMGVAVLSLFRTFPGQAGPLLVGLVITPIAVIAAAFLR